jgi:hypothetical protein
MSKYLITITDNMGEVYDEYVITNPDSLIHVLSINSDLFGIVPGGEWESNA